MHFADFINPKYLLLSKDQLVAADQLLKSYRANGKKAPTGNLLALHYCIYLPKN